MKNKTGQQVTGAARCRGVVIRPLGDVIVLMPPLSITVKELETLLHVVYESIQAVTEKKKINRGTRDWGDSGLGVRGEREKSGR